MVQLFSRLLVAVGGGLIISMLMILLFFWSLDPGFDLVRNALWLIRVLIDLLADFLGWLAATLEGLRS